MWDLIVSDPDHCLSFYFGTISNSLRIYTCHVFLQVSSKLSSNVGCFSIQEQVTLRLIDLSGQISNPSEILCLYWLLSANITKIQTGYS